MPLSPMDIYKDILPKTNCGDCGHPSCFAFATLVVVEMLPLGKCIHLKPEVVAKYKEELKEQYASGKWVKKDAAADALAWARERAASMKISDLPERIGGELEKIEGKDALRLPYFNSEIIIREDDIVGHDGSAMTHYERVFLYNHMAQGGSSHPTGIWKGLEQIPNTISKMKSMAEHVENPIIKKFSSRIDLLEQKAVELGGAKVEDDTNNADTAYLFRPLPRIPVMLLFWDEDKNEGYDARAKLLFDETIVEHLDIESIMFLSERLRQLLCGDE